MKIAMIIVRTLLGALLTLVSVGYFLKLFPQPVLTGDIKTYNDGLAVVNLMVFVKIVELICGLAFLTGRFVALAAVMIFPVALNILLYDIAVFRPGIGAGLFLVFGDLFLAYYFRQKYAPLFTAK